MGFSVSVAMSLWLGFQENNIVDGYTWRKLLCVLEDDFGFQLIKSVWVLSFGYKNQFVYVLCGGGGSRWLQR